MDRRAFIGTLTGAVLAAPLVGEAQRDGKVTRKDSYWKIVEKSA